MKKFLVLFLALSCVISITGCSEQDKKFVNFKTGSDKHKYINSYNGFEIQL